MTRVVQLRPRSRARPPLDTCFSKLTMPAHRTEKTRPKLSLLVPPNLTIPSKTKEIREFLPPEENSRQIPLHSTGSDSTIVQAAATRLGPASSDPNEIEQIRTRQRSIRLNDAERGWTRLNDPDRHEHTISSKTLDLVPVQPRRSFSDLNADRRQQAPKFPLAEQVA